MCIRDSATAGRRDNQCMEGALRAIQPGQYPVSAAFYLVGYPQVQAGQVTDVPDALPFRDDFSGHSQTVAAGQGQIALAQLVLISVKGIGSGQFQCLLYFLLGDCQGCLLYTSRCV